MSQTLQLSDELYRALKRYAAEHQQTPEEALASLLKGVPQTGIEPVREPLGNENEKQDEYSDPWEGFYGAFEAKYPDLIERHDHYI